MTNAAVHFDYTLPLLSRLRERGYKLGIITNGEVYIQRAEKFIQQNYATIRVSDVIEYIGFTRSYFTSCFTRLVGISPQEYILKCKLESSCNLLTRTDLSIQNVAARVGYENQLTFSKIFKKYYGISPLNYRNQQDAKEE